MARATAPDPFGRAAGKAAVAPGLGGASYKQTRVAAEKTRLLLGLARPQPTPSRALALHTDAAHGRHASGR